MIIKVSERFMLGKNMIKSFFIFLILFAQAIQAKTESSLFSCEFEDGKSIELSESSHILYTQFYLYGAPGSSDRNYTVLYFLGAEGEESGERSLVSHRFDPANEIQDHEDMVAVSWKGLSNQDEKGFSALSFAVDLKTRQFDYHCEFQGKERDFPSYQAEISILKLGAQESEVRQLRCVQHPALFSLSYCE